MCGLIAIIKTSVKSKVKRQEIISIRDSMIDRGRDSCGLYLSKDRRIGLGHRRMSIIDLSKKGKQPMSALLNKNLKIIFNGEIYNYQELKIKLIGKGYKFKSNTDTEVILNGYMEWGDNVVKFLEGMFAFIIYDEKKKEIFCARDPFGIKPLYIYNYNQEILLASQVKAILKHKGLNKEICSAGRASYYLWGHIMEPYTLFKNIKCIEAGSILKFSVSGKIKKKFFFSPLKLYQNKKPYKQFNNLNDIIKNSIHKHLISDVPLGVFLSSGIDSSVISYFSSKLSKRKIKTITIGFKNSNPKIFDETYTAQKTAKSIGTMHKNIYIDISKKKLEFGKFLKSMDLPTVDGFNTWLACREAKKNGCKVMLSGLGGDEFFSGYPTLSRANILLNYYKIQKFLKFDFIINKLSHYLMKNKFKYKSIINYSSNVGDVYLLLRSYFLPEQIASLNKKNNLLIGLKKIVKVYRTFVKKLTKLPLELQVKILEMNIYMKSRLLKDADWIGYAHNIELRTPLLDLKVAEISKNMNKKNLFNTAKDLPKEILKKTKTGFAIPKVIFNKNSAEDYKFNIHDYVLKSYLNINQIR
jgi:asparagine synthase (glutamine-hydrolysing)